MKQSKKDPSQYKTHYVNPFSRELLYFLTCAQEQNILKASEILDIQQAGLSKIISKLEFELGEKLFIRSTRGVRLTEYGKVLYDSLIQAKSYWDEIYFNQTKKSLGAVGKLKIGTHPSIAATQLPKFYPALLKQYPSLILETELDTSLQITRKVAQLEIDLGLVINPVKNADLVVRNVRDEYVCVWSNDSNHEKVIFYNPDMFMNQRLLKKFADYRLIPMKDYEIVASLAQSSPFCGILPSTIAERYKLTAVSDKLMSVNLAMIWHKDRFHSSNKSALVDLIVENLK